MTEFKPTAKDKLLLYAYAQFRNTKLSFYKTPEELKNFHRQAVIDYNYNPYFNREFNRLNSIFMEMLEEHKGVIK